MHFKSIWINEQVMEKQTINKENLDRNIWDDNKTDFPLHGLECWTM